MSIYLERGPKTDDELYELVKVLWGHTIPRNKVCPEHDAPFEAFKTAYFNLDTQLLIHGSRGLSGKSRLMSILGLTIAAIKGSDVNILGGSLNQSQNIHDTMRDAWEHRHAPKYLLKDESKTMVRLHNGAKIQPLTASQKTVRGPHPPTLLLDEIDEMDQAILDAAKGQPMPQTNKITGEAIPPFTAMSSTWQYPDKTFAFEYNRMKEEGFPIFTWCYKDTANPIDGWLSMDFVEQKRREMPAEMWRVEYDLGEPSIGTRAFDSESVEQMFSQDFEPTEAEKRRAGKDYEEYHFADHRMDTDYVIAADWAKEMDFTVITVWAVTHLPIQLVHYARMRRRPYPVMIEHYNKLMRRYQAEGIHDATGLGNVVADYLDSRARGFLMTGAQRDNMLSEWVSAVENGKARAPRIPSLYKNHLYCSVDAMYSRGKEFHLPDEVCSSALAWKLVSNRALPVEPITVASVDDHNWMRRQVEHNVIPRPDSAWEVGTVVRTTTEHEYNLMV